MSPAGFESVIPASERPQDHALDRGIGTAFFVGSSSGPLDPGQCGRYFLRKVRNHSPNDTASCFRRQ